ncbi:CGNR zinc finger domain-containing protein [Microbacterium caowuchunii]|uniref:CGNR zinc finger domain-containing protein n=1 Tax=Microbacterium caowuchunii TaxID=2614638 RepID=A0A5N0TL91_9MICO|nr:CGNR zinc finger domain-containing protein [Microbacterium caowuchunii]KAA9135104.1 CGNR zinc finger domain-containing protein [Microbacterium caowuchunii]
MVFTHDTRAALEMAADLVNTLPKTGPDPADRLVTHADMTRLLTAHPYSGVIRRDARELAEVRAIRPRLRELWETPRDEAAPLVNGMLEDGRALPRLVRHDGLDWHIHATDDAAPLATRMLVEAAFAFVDVIRSEQDDRLRVCEADDCAAVYVDHSRNRSKRYCDTGNCGNRMNVNAYRRRRARGTA